MQSPSQFAWPRSGRIPTLDGIRAVSIALVLAAHVIGTGVLPMSGRVSQVAGDLGVRKALRGAGERAAIARAEAWRPWRAYAVMHLWTQGE